MAHGQVETQINEPEQIVFDDNIDDSQETIIVTAERLPGAVITDVQPINELTEADIASYGASSTAELIQALAPQTASSRGRGDGAPVILLNGQRISSFRELRDLPPEAIRQVQIFPEELALQYGYRADQRVVNLILKSGFSAFNFDVDYGQTGNKGQNDVEWENSFTSIGQKIRLSLKSEYATNNAITEDERDIISPSASLPYALGGAVSGLLPNGEIDPALSSLTGNTTSQILAPVSINPNLTDFAAQSQIIDPNAVQPFRTLSPSQDRFAVNGTISYALAPRTKLTANASYELTDKNSLNGLSQVSLLLPDSSIYSPFSNDVLVNNYVTGAGILRSNSTSHDSKFSLGLNHAVGQWDISASANYDISKSNIITSRSLDIDAIQAAILAGTANPFDPNIYAALSQSAPDISDQVNKDLTFNMLISGSIFELPAGPVQMSINSSYADQNIHSMTLRQTGTTNSSLNRQTLSSRLNLNIPILDDEEGFLGKLGYLSLNVNGAADDVSDVGKLYEYGGGVNWRPFKFLNLNLGYTSNENAASISAIGAPIIVTPNVQTFDFTTGNTVFADLISGGNPNLRPERRYDFNIGANIALSSDGRKSLQLNLVNNRTENSIGSLPLLTPLIETYFPERVVRDSFGQLVSVDRRSINIAEEKSKTLRWGLNLSGQFMPKSAAPQSGPNSGQEGAPRAGGGPRGEGPRGAGGGGAGGGGSRGGGGPGGMFGGNRPDGGWQLSLFHNIQLKDQAILRTGLPVLDRLDGFGVSGLGGTPRHSVTMEGGLFYKGMGSRVSATYRGKTKIASDSMTNSEELFFSDKLDIDLRFFINLDERAKWLKSALPFMKGTRLSFVVNNILDDYVTTVDGDGLVPIGYQRDLIDPVGRRFEIGLRKLF
ncbi:hypothetical protein LPB140_10615 [Sphingorhabdus lutea]|uniref:TonB-dependent receptor n=1 Tax=Sphingorhabdus lutea TaxID=1913578 RepID=A0A1L3JDD3_9SPHN|nr:hypothetical protein [Sphingorhabdus lutea]APG63167.1 hypothetical protein LPB140_10615 [Sphingorhabdus lutea]